VTKKELLALLEGVRAGSVAPEDAARKLRAAPFEDLGFAKVDHGRALRQGAAEVVYGEGKTAEQVCAIVRKLREGGAKTVLATRLSPEKAAALAAAAPDASYDPTSRLAVAGPVPEPDGRGTICVCAAGTSDLPVAEEAARTAEALGNRVERLYDVGVAGLERLLSRLDTILAARVVVVVAGMEGALASVVGGLVDVPVVAAPTSVGYGAAFEGLAALLAMLNSCAAGVSVVNIDNGFGAGFLASRINHMG
jgi:NCAIR mutase (PurE)-related protein